MLPYCMALPSDVMLIILHQPDCFSQRSITIISLLMFTKFSDPEYSYYTQGSSGYRAGIQGGPAVTLQPCGCSCTAMTIGVRGEGGRLKSNLSSHDLFIAVLKEFTKQHIQVQTSRASKSAGQVQTHSCLPYLGLGTAGNFQTLGK